MSIRLVQVNGMGVTASTDRTERIVVRASKRADILTGVEAANVDVADLLGPTWDVAQNTSRWAKQGSFVAARRSVGKIKRKRVRLLVPARLNGRRANQMADRYYVRARIKLKAGGRIRVIAAHLPPKRNWGIWWNAAIVRLHALRVQVLGCDWNKDRAGVRKWFPGRRVRIHGIDGYVIRRGWRASAPKAFDVGSDHPAIAVTIQRKKRP